MAGALSAFAARRAASKPTQSPGNEQVNAADADEEIRFSPQSKKRRKTQENDGNLDEYLPITLSNDQQMEHGEVSNDGESLPSDSDLELEDSSVSVSRNRSELSSEIWQLSTFVPTKKNILSDTEDQWTVRLHPKDRLALLGYYDIWVRSGAISIFGAIIHASSKLYRVYAPSTHAIPPIRSVPNPYGTGDPPTEVSFFSCGSRLRLLKQISPKFGRIWNGRKGHRGSNRSFVNLQTSAEDSNGRSLCLLNLPSNWQTTIARIQSVSSTQHLAVMVCGLKGAGKSTFCRILANALLSKTSMSSSNSTQIIQSVAFMDLDPGQPEYSPSGELSLLSLKDFHLGPPFTHPVPGSGNTVIRSHHFGHLSPKENSEYYHHCVLDLYQKYRKKMASSPLIVNYSSWIQSSGLELLTGLIKDVDLSDMIYMSSTGPEEVVDALQQAVIRRDVPLHQLTSQASQVPTRTAADLRMMSTLSYFHVGSIEAGNIRWNTSPLSDQIPLIARYGGLDSDILAVMVLGDAQNMQFLESMLEGCVVGVVVLEDDAGIPRNNAQVDHWTLRTNIQGRSPHREEAHPSIRHTKSGIPYIRAEQHTIKPLDPARSYSLGQAIIRAIDTQVKAFQLLTPIPREIILQTKQQGRKIVLVRGRLDTPTWAYAERLMLDRHVKFRIENETGEREDNATDEVKEWALRQPWASVVKRGRSGSAKVRRVRRDLRYRSQPETA